MSDNGTKPGADTSKMTAASDHKRSRGALMFTEGPIPYLMRRMAVPMLMGLAAMIVASLADTYFLAKLGTTHLAAITFTFPVVMLLSNLTIGIGSGFSSLLARALGEGAGDKVQKLTMSAMLLSSLAVLFLSLIGYFTIDPLFTALGAGPEALVLIREYMSIWYLAIVFIVVPMTGNFALRASGNPGAASSVMIISAIVNIIIDPILIFGFLFIPEMGMKGAAIAGVISRGVSFAATFYILGVRNKLIARRLPPLDEILDAWRDILRIGGPLAMTNMIVPVSAAFITYLLAQFGEETVAGFGVAARIEALAAIPLMAVGSSISPIVGQNFGATRYGRVAETMKTGFMFFIFYGLFASVVLALGRNAIPAFFDPNPEVIKTASLYLVIVPIGYVAMGLSMVVGASYTGMGNPRPSVVMSLGRMVVVYIPLAYIGSKFFGPAGIFAAGTAANYIVGIAAFYFALWQGRKAISAGHLQPADIDFRHSQLARRLGLKETKE